MVLSSPGFLLFFLAAAALYYALPWKMRNVFLLLASFTFYAFSAPHYLPLIILTAVGSYVLARGVDGQENRKARKALTVVGIVALVAVLCLFKYAAAPLGALVKDIPVLGILARETNAGFALIMPVGISFYTFAIIGYILDVFNKKIKAEKNIVDYALFVSFFPCILSGPINRAGEMLPQFKEEHTWSYENTVDGLQRFLWGALKKVVIADGVSLIVNGVWSSLNEYHGLTIAVTMILYMIQIYCDFSGYSDMAVGTAKILGFTVRENFAAPYLAHSISGFWSRWHMSLSSWLKDYIYIPLGGSRKGFPRKLVNIAVVFIISGLWHGERPTFLVWGVFHALLRCAQELMHRIRPADKAKTPHWLRWLVTTGVVCLTWVFFRAPSLGEAKLFFSNLKGPYSASAALAAVIDLVSDGLADSGTYYVLFFGILAMTFFALVFGDSVIAKNLKNGTQNPLNPFCAVKSQRLRMVVYWVLALSVMLFYFISFTKQNGEISFIYAGF